MEIYHTYSDPTRFQFSDYNTAIKNKPWYDRFYIIRGEENVYIASFNIFQRFVHALLTPFGYNYFAHLLKEKKIEILDPTSFTTTQKTDQQFQRVSPTMPTTVHNEKEASNEKQDAIRAILENSNPGLALSNKKKEKNIAWVLEAFEAYRPNSDKEKVAIFNLLVDLATESDIRTDLGYMERIVQGLERLMPLSHIPMHSIFTYGIYCIEDSKYIDVAGKLIRMILQCRSDSISSKVNEAILSTFSDVLNRSASSGFDANLLVIDAIRDFDVKDNDDRMLYTKCFFIADSCQHFAQYHLSDEELSRLNLSTSLRDNHFVLGKKLLEAFQHFLTTDPGKKHITDNSLFQKTEEYIQKIAQRVKSESREGISLDFKAFLLALKSYDINHVTRCVDSIMSDIQKNHPSRAIRDAFTY